MWGSKALRTLFSAKRLLFGDQCLRIIAETAEEVGRTAAVTLGPMGRNVIIENEKGEPRITKDGVTVVKHIEYEDRLKDAVCTLIKKSANGTNRFAGDGTTTSTILISQIVKEGRKSLQTGAAIRDIKEGLLVGRNLGMEFLKMAAQQISTEEDFHRVAMIATKGDKLLSSLVSKAVSSAQIIKVEKTHRTDSYVEFYTGLKMVSGIPHPDFKNVGDKVELDYPLVLLDQNGINKVQDILPALQLAKKARKQLLIVSSAISDAVLSTLIYNKRKNIVEAFPLILHNYGTIAKDYMRQLALTSEATIFNQFGPSIRQVQYSHLGRAIRVDMDELETSVLGKRSDVCTNSVIYAGGSTEAVALEIYDKIIDALNSVQTAKKHGVVAGGGVTYWRMADMLEAYRGQFEPGVKVLARALRSPRKRLVEALPEAYTALGGVGWEGFNFKTRKIEDMLVAGVIDSAIVGESVLVDAVSLGRMLLDISVCVVRASRNIENKKEIEQLSSQHKI